MPRKLIFVSVIVIVIVTLVTYYPGLRMDFIYDDWKNLETLGRLGPERFIQRSFDLMEPSFLTAYRPLQGLLLGVEYSVFGKNPLGYHTVHIILHLVNCLLVYLIIWAIFKNLCLTLLTGLLYATFPIYGLSVFLPSAPDVLAALFYFLAIGSWVIYLQSKRLWPFALTHFFFVFGLLSKEIVLSLPVTLILLDLLLLKSSRQIVVLFQRYLFISGILLVYAIFYSSILSRVFLYYAYGMGVGSHFLSNLRGYMSGLLIPWSANVNHLLMLLLGVVLLCFLVVRSKTHLLAFIGTWAILNILPVLGLQTKFSPRYLYLSGVASAILWAMIIESGRRVLGHYRYSSVIASSVVIVLLFLNTTGVNHVVQEIEDDTRAQRAPFRDIARQNPVFPSGTYLNFIDPPAHINELSGMFYVRYGDAVTVGVIKDERVQLKKYVNPLIYYFDLSGKPVQVEVKKKIATSTMPSVPVNFNNLILLEDYELSNSLEQGRDIVLFLYWRALQKITDDYTVFVHVVCSKERVAGEDSQPARGKRPTSSWIPGHLVVDTIILPIPMDLESKRDCNLEIGLYYLPTLQRLAIVDEQNTPISDHIKIEYLAIQE